MNRHDLYQTTNVRLKINQKIKDIFWHIQARILASALFSKDIDVGHQDGHQDQFPEFGLKNERTKVKWMK